MKARDILTAVVLMLAQMGSTMKFVAAGEVDIEDDRLVNRDHRYAQSKRNVKSTAESRREEQA